MKGPANFERVDSGGSVELRFTGNLSLAYIDDLPARLAAVKGPVRADIRSAIERRAPVRRYPASSSAAWTVVGWVMEAR